MTLKNKPPAKEIDSKEDGAQKPIPILTQKIPNVLSLTHEDACAFFLKEKSYCNFDLPKYFKFEPILLAISEKLAGRNLSDFHETKPEQYDDVNYKLLNNKDGRYGWRPLQLIHPALFVALVHEITNKDNWDFICNRFKDFSSSPKIECVSIPVVSVGEESDKAQQVNQWWHEVEQKSITLALDYSHLVHIDLADCYGSIYTHSIAWALHNKEPAKAKRNERRLLGNVIDSFLRGMSHGQTNGIPQGSVIMDFIAEMVLGYADFLLAEKIGEDVEYHIVRYRDDYRIFTHSSQDSEKIVKYLTEIMISLGLRLNPNKTKSTTNLIREAIKSDKIYWMGQKQQEKSLQKHLLIIHKLSEDFPNSGSLIVALDNFHKRVIRLKKITEDILPLISIAVDIAYNNPKSYAISTAILSKFIECLGADDQKHIIMDKIKRRFDQIPNTGYLMAWLQRITITFDRAYNYDEPLCKLVSNNANSQIWNSEWLKNPLKETIESTNIIDDLEITELPQTIEGAEVELFKSKGEYYW